MQAGEDGLKGNLISADRLIRVLTDYLQNQGFSDPREKANLLIQQLCERNFILCDRGADTYSFMHRTFLEHFCAVEIVHRFEKQRTLTFEQLRDEVFGQHWQDETWHEVLRLICGMICTSFSHEIIKFLLRQEDIYGRFMNIFMADDILFDIGNKEQSTFLREEVFEKLKEVILISKEKNVTCQEKSFFDTWMNEDRVGCLQSIFLFDKAIKEGWLEFTEDGNQIYIELPQTALEKYPDAGNILAKTVQNLLEQEIDLAAPIIESLRAIIQHHSDNPKVFDYLVGNALDLGFKHRDDFAKSLIHLSRDRLKTIDFLKGLVINDPDEQLREWAQQQLEKIEREE
jgi:hypothetical protein